MFAQEDWPLHEDFYGEASILPMVQIGATRRASWTLTDVTIHTLSASDKESGFIGFYPAESALLEIGGQFQGESRGPGSIGNRTSDGESPDTISYSHAMLNIHCLVAGQAEVVLRGLGAMKARGPTSVLSAAENVSTIQTGATRTPTHEMLTWLYLEFHEVATVMFGGAKFEAAAASQEIRWDGALRFQPVSGGLSAAEGEYIPNSWPAEIVGEFTGRLTPIAGSRTEVTLSGDLQSTSMKYRPTPVIGESPGRSWLALALVGTALVSAAGGAFGAITLLQHRRRRQATSVFGLPPTVEDCIAAADDAVEADDYRAALTWYNRAWQLAPTSAIVAMQRAYCLEKLRQPHKAMDAYAEADRLSPSDGQPALCMAWLLEAMEAPRERVQSWLKVALEKSPALVDEIRPDFPERLDDPDWAALFLRAERLREQEWCGGHEE